MCAFTKRMTSVGSHVLINGVTGLLGGEILRELCRQRAASVTALVRCTEQESPRERFVARMARSNGSIVEIDTPVRVHSGDIVKPYWGLSKESLADVRDQVDTIVHCAADTSFIRENSVVDTNIRGTRNLIDLARSFAVSPRIIYISTATNVGRVQHCCVREEQGCRADNEHHNAYTRSKAIAESMLRDSGLDVLVIRPTIVLSAGLADRTFARNILWFAPLIYAFDALPVDPNGEIDLISSDFVAQCTVELMRTRSLKHDCYHISAGLRHGITIREALEVMASCYQRPVPELIPPEQWSLSEQRRYVRTREQRMIFHALRYYLPFLNMDVTYDNARLYDALGERVPAFQSFNSYAAQLLSQIDMEEAIAETALP